MKVKISIYFFIFIFILIGVFGITAWVAIDQIPSPLDYAVIAFMWGVTLAVLYLTFDKAGWNWWGN